MLSDSIITFGQGCIYSLFSGKCIFSSLTRLRGKPLSLYNYNITCMYIIIHFGFTVPYTSIIACIATVATYAWLLRKLFLIHTVGVWSKFLRPSKGYKELACNCACWEWNSYFHKKEGQLYRVKINGGFELNTTICTIQSLVLETLLSWWKTNQTLAINPNLMEKQICNIIAEFLF